jgi:hypothetical protein
MCLLFLCVSLLTGRRRTPMCLLFLCVSLPPELPTSHDITRCCAASTVAEVANRTDECFRAVQAASSRKAARVLKAVAELLPLTSCAAKPDVARLSSSSWSPSLRRFFLVLASSFYETDASIRDCRRSLRNTLKI